MRFIILGTYREQQFEGEPDSPFELKDFKSFDFFRLTNEEFDELIINHNNYYKNLNFDDELK